MNRRNNFNRYFTVRTFAESRMSCNILNDCDFVPWRHFILTPRNAQRISIEGLYRICPLTITNNEPTHRKPSRLLFEYLQLAPWNQFVLHPFGDLGAKLETEVSGPPSSRSQPRLVPVPDSLCFGFGLLGAGATTPHITYSTLLIDSLIS